MRSLLSFILIRAALSLMLLSNSATAASQQLPPSAPATEIHIRAGNYFFRPNHVIVEVNKPVILSAVKEPGLVPHNFILQAPEAHLSIAVSLDTKPKVIAFTPTQTGQFTFYCDKQLLFFKSHREKGMTGILEVVGRPNLNPAPSPLMPPSHPSPNQAFVIALPDLTNIGLSSITPHHPMASEKGRIFGNHAFH
jgi:plastocyanin